MCACFSCKAIVPDVKGSVHRYMSSSPGCWKLFGEVLEKEYSDPAYRKNHRITVDAYAVQHPGDPSPQSIQSVNLHLASLCLIFEKGFNVKKADKGLTRLAKYKKELLWLEPPASMGRMDVTDLLQATNAEEHCRLVLEWGRSAWKAWEAHHPVIRAFIERHSAVVMRRRKAA